MDLVFWSSETSATKRADMQIVNDKNTLGNEQQQTQNKQRIMLSFSIDASWPQENKKRQSRCNRAVVETRELNRCRRFYQQRKRMWYVLNATDSSFKGATSFRCLMYFISIFLRHLVFLLKCKIRCVKKDGVRNIKKEGEKKLGYQMRWLVRWLLKCSVALRWRGGAVWVTWGGRMKSKRWAGADCFGEGSSRTQREPETTFSVLILGVTIRKGRRNGSKKKEFVHLFLISQRPCGWFYPGSW